MAARWDQDEIDWARECAAAGDTTEEIAEWSGRTVLDVRRALRGLRKLTAYERTAASLYAAGVTIRDIGRALKADTTRPDSLGWQALKRIREKGYALPTREDRVSKARIAEMHHGR